MIRKFSTLLITTTLLLNMLPSAMAKSGIKNEPIVHSVVQSYNVKHNGFNDIANHPAKEAIEYLVGRDVIMGYNNESFRPDAILAHAEAITLLTKAFDLKANEQSQLHLNDLYTHLQEQKWYSHAYMMAHLNEIKLSKDVKINDTVTREQFASWIINQFDRIGPYPVIKMYINIADGEQISNDYTGDVQTLLLTGITKLSEEQTFRPKDAITRGEAAQWMAKAVEFADNLRAQQNQTEDLTENLPFEFKAESELKHAEALTLLTKALELNGTGEGQYTLDKLAVDFKNIKSDEWYSPIYLKALNNEVVMAKDVNPSDTVTKEQFAGWIIDQFDRIGPYPVIMMYIHILDEEAISPELTYKIQTLLLTGITSLDEEGKFNPQQPITGAEAVAWLEKAADFAKRIKQTAEEIEQQQTIPFTSTEKIVDERTKEVSINLELPHPGYGAKVESVKYENDIAVVNVEIIEPDPDKMYPQVITSQNVKAYVEAGYDVKINILK